MVDASPRPRRPGFATLAIHAGAESPAMAGAPAMPVDGEGGDPAAPFRPYAVPGPPPCTVLEERIAALEGGTAAVAMASGPTAQLLVLQLLMQPDDEIVAAPRLAGGSISRCLDGFRAFGWQVRWADPDDLAAVEAAVTPRTKAILVETLAHADGGAIDIAAVAAVAQRAHVPLVVYNTLATPFLTRPIEHGADIVVHAATGYLAGHPTSPAGILVDGGTFDWLADAKYPALSAPRADHAGLVLGQRYGNFAFAMAARMLGRSDAGPALSPFDATALLHGLETLPLRMQRHCDNALAVARHLSGHSAVADVTYAGLDTSPSHGHARRYGPGGAGAVFAFRLRGGAPAEPDFMRKLRIFSPHAGDGGARSRLIHPFSTTHRHLTEAQRLWAGAGPDVLRVSVGLEDAADLTDDLDQALVV